jgi:hypothetical protein
MHRTVARVQISSWLPALILGLAALGCESGGVGEPCVPEDEYQTRFSGFAETEVNVESRSFQCETRVCLVNHFQGRVSCKYGQAEGETLCTVPGDDQIKIEVPVQPQLRDRQAERAVYCSCRCNGPDENARYCECPSGYTCAELVDDLALGGGQLAGSYCIKDSTKYDPKALKPNGTCTRSAPGAFDGTCGAEFGHEEEE